MITLPEDVRRVLDESYGQRLKKKKYAVKLDCWRSHRYQEPTIVELESVAPVTVTCPICGRRHYIDFRRVIPR